MAITPPGSRSDLSSHRSRAARRELTQAQTQGLDQASIVLSYLISGVLLWGAGGWLADHLLGTHHVFTPIGIVIGAGLGCYLIIHRFGGLGRNKKATEEFEPTAADSEDA